MSGTEFIAACGLVILALVLTLTLKKDAPSMAFLLSLAAGAVILIHVFTYIGDAASRFHSLLLQAGMDDALYSPVMKSVGVAAVMRIVGALCRDAGQSALAVKLELAGTLLALTFCIPLLEQVLTLVS